MKIAHDPAKPQETIEASIVTVVDYKAGHEGAWADLQATLQGLKAQDFEGTVELLLVEARDARMSIPTELLEMIAGTRLIQIEGETSYDLKNAGAQAARSDWVIILDADCPPHPQWLSALVAHKHKHPEASVISGRTFYRAEGLLPRILALLDRCYVDAGEAGATQAISTNNSAFQRSVLLQYPMMNDIGPYGSKPHSNKLLAAGKILNFEPDMLTYHAYGGWEMVRETRRQTGYSMAMYRVLDRNARYAGLYRLKELGLPVIVGMSILDSCFKCVRFRKQYKIKVHELPYAWLVAIRSHLMEIPGLREGMHNARSERFIAYR